METKGYVVGTTLDDDSGEPRKMYLTSWMRGSNGRQDNYFINEEFYRDGDKWRHNPPMYVPIASSFDILGYTCSVPIPSEDVLWGFPNNSERMRITFGADHLQDDILYGAAYGNASGADGSVQMQMYHAQAWIEVILKRKEGATGADAILSAVSLEKLYTGCELTVEALDGYPEAHSRMRRFVADDYVMGDPVGLYNNPITVTGGSLRMLVPSQEQTSLKIDYVVSGCPLSKSLSLPHTYWEMGKHYVYEVIFDPIDEVFILGNVTVASWTVGADYTEHI